MPVRAHRGRGRSARAGCIALGGLIQIEQDLALVAVATHHRLHQKNDCDVVRHG